jgi:hypothetical protein
MKTKAKISMKDGKHYVHLFGAWQQIEKWWWEQLEERGAEIVEYGEA